MKIRKIKIKNQETDELVKAEQLICDCGQADFIVYSIGEDHTHLQCTSCDQVHCSLNPSPKVEDIPSKTICEESGGFSE